MPVHPIGAAAIDFLRSRILEEIHPRMLEKAPDDGTHLDVIGDAANAGLETTHAADDEVDADAGARGAVKRLNDGRLGQRVELRDNACRLAGPRVLSLAVDFRQ